MSGSQPRSFRAWGVAVVASLLAVAAGCASDPSTPSSPTSSPSPTAVTSESPTAAAATSYPAGKEDICRARDQLKTSIGDLTDTKLLTGGTDAIKAGVAQVQTDFEALKAAAKDDYQAPVAAMQTALQQLQTAASGLGSGDASTNLAAIGVAIVNTGTAAQALFTQLTAACGS